MFMGYSLHFLLPLSISLFFSLCLGFSRPFFLHPPPTLSPSDSPHHHQPSSPLLPSSYSLSGPLSASSSTIFPITLSSRTRVRAIYIVYEHTTIIWVQPCRRV
ncbi:uncharacterized protein CCOS01_02666 [Colletotrichum costaricense]|uniref:Uncharacterized protein n=1 Tax=Colletotrichum costaricense TaxID=1209916 RepID=A0AAI9Z879_9PEZI|nr:uncharacterized protein CCOS01_02666 [Colletotrichum costaricense]KAK1537346.1 hypothetical protein CCOS01_02666 [Colletotrichum costaricense]